MTVTDTLRKAIVESGTTHYAIQQATGINARAIDRFVGGTDIRGMTIDRLCDYFGLELHRKAGESARKPPAKKRGAKQK